MPAFSVPGPVRVVNVDQVRPSVLKYRWPVSPSPTRRVPAMSPWIGVAPAGSVPIVQVTPSVLLATAPVDVVYGDDEVAPATT